MIDKKIQLASKIECTGCSACASICPSKCISMVENREGFLQPRIKARDCLHCHLCEKTCPILNTNKHNPINNSRAYAAINKDEGIRLKSSSGGIFYALSKRIIEDGGVVFGAKFDDDFYGVHHDFSDSLLGIEPFMRSKYVQSKIGESFKIVKQFLCQGRLVMFSGTPCQVQGLLNFLGQRYENLITIDLICHGVPSPGIWKHYLNGVSKGKTITNVNFRDKISGWINYNITISYSNDLPFIQKKSENQYLLGFLRSNYLRRSCYACHYRTFERNSDITIADYWGIESICPNMFDNKGTSFVISHSNKGENLLNSVSDNLLIIDQNREDALKYNKGAAGENPRSRRRKIVFLYYSLGLTSLATYAACHDSPIVRIRRRIKRLIKTL